MRMIIPAYQIDNKTEIIDGKARRVYQVVKNRNGMVCFVTNSIGDAMFGASILNYRQPVYTY
jgi:hypothetical protein